jgi:hypothetical protein
MRFIAAAHADGGFVIVHCLEGRSRSVAVALAYQAARRGEDLIRPVVDVFPKYLREAAAFCGAPVAFVRLQSSGTCPPDSKPRSSVTYCSTAVPRNLPCCVYSDCWFPG